MHRGRDLFLIWPPLLALVLSGYAGVASAASAPSLYTAVVPDADPQQAAQDAMRAVLVRLTGSRDAASDPGLAALVTDAAHYVQLQRTTTTGATQVLFDGNTLSAAISSAGRSIWSPERPLLWVTLPQQDQSINDALRTRLQAAAQARGLPITISIGRSADQAATADALLEAAHRAGASAALLAAPTPNDPATLQWSLAAAGASGQWSGGPELAIDGATDTLVRATQAVEAAPLAEFECHIAGVVDLPSFATVLGAVSAAPGVTEAAVRAIQADTITLQLKAHGDQASLERALTNERLHPTGATAAGALDYRYQAGL